MVEVLSDAKRKMERALEDIPETAFVYATYSDAFPGLVKIGRSCNVKSRISSGNTFSAPAPHCVICMAATLNAKRDEEAAHEFFRQFRKEGEFFEISHREVENYFNAIINKQYWAEQKQFFQNSKAGDSSLIKIIESNATSNSVVSEACHAALVNDHFPGGILKDSALDDMTMKYQNESKALSHMMEFKTRIMESKARIMESKARIMESEAESRQLKIQWESMEIQKNALELKARKYSTCQASIQAVAADTLMDSSTKVFMTDQIKNDMLDSSSNLINQTRLFENGEAVQEIPPSLSISQVTSEKGLAKTSLTIPVMSRFLSAVIKKPGFQGMEIIFIAMEFFKMYMTFTSSGNYKSIKTVHMFAKELKKYPGITSRHITTGTEYTIDQQILKDHLVHNKQLDDDVSYDFCQSAA
jgi:hypothetical protein